MSAVELGEESIEAIARRVVELLEPTPKLARGLVDAATVARELGTSRDFVFRHKRELGARRLGNGPKGRLRFDLATARAAYDELRAVPEPLSPTKPARKTPSDDNRAQASRCFQSKHHDGGANLPGLW